MSGRASLEQVVAGLRAEGQLAETAQAEALIARLRGTPPWYVRAMVGFGAWLASLLLIGFVAGFSLAVGGVVVVGLLLIAGATALRWGFDNDFVVQATLAASVAGQALLAYGIADQVPRHEVQAYCASVIVISALLFFGFPDRIHRVLSLLFAVSAGVVWLYVEEANELIPLLGPALAAALVLVHEQRARLVAAGAGQFVRPLESGLMLAAFGCLLLSTVYVLPELELDFRFYPRPWISTVLLGGLFLYVGVRVWPPLLRRARPGATIVVLGLMLALIAAAWSAPGLLLALIVALLGAASGNRFFAGAGIGFMGLFVATFFYGIEVSMLAKSLALVASGGVILLARWLLLTMLGEADHD